MHAHARTRAPLQDAFVAIRLHTTLDASEPQRRGNFSHVLASPEEMAARFTEYPEAVEETARLAGELRFDLGSDLGYRYPGAEDDGAMRTLVELCDDRLHKRYAEESAAVRDHGDLRVHRDVDLVRSDCGRAAVAHLPPPLVADHVDAQAGRSGRRGQRRHVVQREDPQDRQDEDGEDDPSAQHQAVGPSWLALGLALLPPLRAHGEWVPADRYR